MREIVDMVSPLGIEVHSLADIGWEREIPETAATFEANAVLKAEVVRDETGLVVLADDSGLEVDGLCGLPGVMSARFAGPDADDEARNRELVRLLSETSDDPPWPAQYRCVIALARPGELTTTFEGLFRGAIVPEPRGTGGFGYDPYFLLPDKDVTVGEISLEEKQAISHRGKALGQLVKWIESGGEPSPGE